MYVYLVIYEGNYRAYRTRDRAEIVARQLGVEVITIEVIDL